LKLKWTGIFDKCTNSIKEIFNVIQVKLLKRFVLFLLVFLVFVNPAYGQPANIDIDWLIEGQISHQSDLENSAEKVLLSNFDGLLDTEENLIEFVTKNQYSIDGNAIDINSDDGEILNKILIEQRKIQKENFLHLIHYLDRHSDGYVELTEPLLDPLTPQSYLINGRTYDSNINSNLEYYLFERGFSLDDLESIPNNVFSPVKYKDARLATTQTQNNNVGSFDLRTLTPYYVEVDTELIHEKMIDTMSKQTLDVFNSVLSDDRSSFNPLFDLEKGAFDSSFENSMSGIVKFENTQHAIDLLDVNSPNPVLKSDNYTILILIPVVVGLAIMAYLFQKKIKTRLIVPILDVVPTSTNYQNHTKEMLESSMILFQKNSQKEAFEKFSQAIRYYYSHKLKIDMEMTTFEIMLQLKKHDIENFNDVQKWLMLCGRVEFTKYDANKKEFIAALSAFSKLLS
jgi:hypothetical protein